MVLLILCLTHCIFLGAVAFVNQVLDWQIIIYAILGRLCLLNFNAIDNLKTPQNPKMRAPTNNTLFWNCCLACGYSGKASQNMNFYLGNLTGLPKLYE